jgi:hypothetical protein
MCYPTTRLSGCLRFLLIACTVAAAGCGNSTRQYEVDYNYEVTRSAARFQVSTRPSGSMTKTA